MRSGWPLADWMSRWPTYHGWAESGSTASRICRSDGGDAGDRLRRTAFSTGPWDLILSCCFLDRTLIGRLADYLTPHGIAVVIQPTRKNLERHEKPPAAYLLRDGELPNLIRGVDIVRYEEGWLADGRHDALLVARVQLDER